MVDSLALCWHEEAGGGEARRVITAFGTGVGIGAAWTKTSIDIEQAVKGMQ